MNAPLALRKPASRRTARPHRVGCGWAGVVCETLLNPWIWTVALGIVLVATR